MIEARGAELIDALELQTVAEGRAGGLADGPGWLSFRSETWVRR